MFSLETIKQDLDRKLPIIISREEAAKFTGGVYCPATLRNFDCAGIGPKNTIRIGKRKVCYNKQDFIDWFMAKLEVMENVND